MFGPGWNAKSGQRSALKPRSADFDPATTASFRCGTRADPWLRPEYGPDAASRVPGTTFRRAIIFATTGLVLAAFGMWLLSTNTFRAAWLLGTVALAWGVVNVLAGVLIARRRQRSYSWADTIPAL